MNAQSYIHCLDHAVTVEAGTLPLHLSVRSQDSSSSVTLFLSEDQANEIILKLSNAVTEYRAQAKARDPKQPLAIANETNRVPAPDPAVDREYRRVFKGASQ
jgi:hypothetical protein